MTGAALAAGAVFGVYLYRDRHHLAHVRQRRRRIEAGDLSALSEPEEYEAYESGMPTPEERAAMPATMAKAGLLGAAFGLAQSLGDIDLSSILFAGVAVLVTIGSLLKLGIAPGRDAAEEQDRIEKRSVLLKELGSGIALALFAAFAWFATFEPDIPLVRSVLESGWLEIVIPLVMVGGGAAWLWTLPRIEREEGESYWSSLDDDPRLGEHIAGAVLLTIGLAILVSRIF